MKSVRYSGGLSLLGLSMLMAVTPVSAQTAPTVPGTTREEVNRVPVGPDTRAPSRLTVDGGIERAPCPLADPRFADVMVTISAVEFANLRGVAPDALRPAYEAYVGKSVPIATVCEIRDAAATILRRAGFLAAVQVPPQKIENGVVRFDVLMAKLVAVQVRGDAGKSERLIAGYLGALKNGEVFNEHDAERYLLLARDLPGYDVRLTLRPAGATPGEVIGEVTVVKQPYAVNASIQNFGSKSVGRFGGLIQGEAYDLLGSGDRLSLGFFSTPDFDEQHVVQSAYDIRVGNEGLTLGGRFTYAWAKPDLNGSVAGIIKSHTLVAAGEASYPFVRTQTGNMRAAFGFEYINQNVFFNSALFNQDRLRVLYGRVDFDVMDAGSIRDFAGYSAAEPKWRVGGSIEVRKGIDIFGATRSCGPNPYKRCTDLPVRPSRLDGNPTAGVVRFTGTGEYRPTPLLTLAVSPRLQYSRSGLLSYEEFSAGNYTIGRGYDPGSLIGDSGAGFQAEIRYGRLIPRSATSFAVQPYVFYDRAWIWNHDNVDATVRPDPQELASAGGGIRVTYGDRGRVDFTVAQPLDRLGSSTRRGDTRFLVSLSTRLLPWNR